jgi:hypothetical protein
MNGIPQDVDFGFFTGTELQQVCVGPGDIILNLFPDTSISITGRVAVVPTVDLGGVNDRNGTILSLVKLLGSRITKVEIDGLDTLVLIFGDSVKVILRDDDPHYECFVITSPGQTIVI